ADAVSQRRACPRTRHDQVGEPARALDDHGVGVEWAALAAGECAACVVSRALWSWWQTFATDGDGGGGAQVTHGAVAFPRDRGDTRGCGTQRSRSAGLRRCHASVWVLVEAARSCTGPA